MINKNSPLEEISNTRDEVQKELQVEVQNYEMLANKRHKIQRLILKLRIKIKDLDIPFEKSKSNKERLRIEEKILTDYFWGHKNP